MKITSQQKTVESVIYEQSKTENNYWLIFSMRYFCFVLWVLFFVFIKKQLKRLGKVV